jgi:pyruvate dehydrogenase E1 component beta subunit
MDTCFYDLDAPVIRVAAEDVPIPYNTILEAEVIPTENDIYTTVKQVLEE